MNLAWLTDIHLNFLDKEERETFYREIINDNSDAVLITGDIAEATSVKALLIEMVDFIKKPIYFVLGNHDYYKGAINKVRESLRTLTHEHDLLFWLPALGIQELNNSTVLVGQDGWADGRFGDYYNSNVILNDSRMNVDLFQAKILGKSHLLEKMQQLADSDALQMKKNIVLALNQNPSQIIVLTHIPPFKEVSQHEGKICDPNRLPYFSSKIMGEVLMQIAQENPLTQFLVLCGHTHSEAFFQPLENLIIKAGKAQYYQPAVQEIITI